MKDADVNSIDPVVLITPLFGNPNKASEFIVSLDCKDDAELRAKLIQVMQAAKTEADNKLQTMNRKELESNFKAAYKGAMGEYNAEEITEKFIQSSKTNAMFLETTAIIGTSLLTAGSATVIKLGSKAVNTLGARLGSQAIKAGMTAATAAMPAAETIVGGLTSKEGLTLDKGNEAWEQLKSGLMYGAFGTYVSGPLGNVVKNTLAKNPNIFKSILSSHKFTLVAGTATETTADAIFDRLTSDMSIRESLEQNGLMNFGMMIAGARMNGAANTASGLTNVKIEKMKDGTYNIKENGRVLCKAKDENELAFVVLSLAAEKSKIQPENSRSNSSSISDIRYTKSSILKLIDTNLDLKNNEWVQANIKRIIDDCSDDIRQNTFEDNLSHPLLLQHRMKILNTFLSDPKMYNDKTLQNNLASLIIEFAKDAKSAQNICDSMIQYSNIENKNEIIKESAHSIITNKNLSVDNKQKLYDFSQYFSSEENTKWIYEELCRDVSDYEFDFVINLIKEDVKINSNYMHHFFTEGERHAKKIVKARIEFYNELKNYQEIDSSARMAICTSMKPYTLKFARQMLKDKNCPKEIIYRILQSTRKGNINYAIEFYSNPDIPKYCIPSLTYHANDMNIEFIRKLIKDKEFPKENIANIAGEYTFITKNLIELLYQDKAINLSDIGNNLKRRFPVTEELVKVIEETYYTLKQDNNFPEEYISKILACVNENNRDFAIDMCKNYKENKLPINLMQFIINHHTEISVENLQKLKTKMKPTELEELSDSELLIAAKYADIYGMTSINEIPMECKQRLLKELVAVNSDLFNNNLKKHFPLLPVDQETYCSLLPALVKSLGVDIRTIEPPSRIKEFNNNMSDLSSSLARLSDSDFSNLNIKQEYSKDSFINDVVEKTKNLSDGERQKVYDYFGFELHPNPNNETGFTILGYPINLNNGKKLAEITDPKTKAVVESLRPDVVRFSENNKITCSNPYIEKLLNKIVDILPELRTQIGKKQHSAHNYDVFTHSLKVMQKITQDPKFNTLNESDKKIMMLASLLHDITKREGFSDKSHAAQGSFDTFFIGKKFNLTREEELKLYTLTRNHEWLAYVNTAKTEEVLTKRLQSVAYDLQHDNLFDMALIFTHADLKAVKKDDSFHDTTEGNSRIDFNGNVRSFGKSADVYAARIKQYIEELKVSQPLLPVTPIPKASKINEAITTVRVDGSTNIKGVYKREDGLIVIKFNEVEDWEAIGFPKGSVSRGYQVQGGRKINGTKYTEDVNTGNIKFFVHGLNYENQLAKFDAFSLIDSDALLSVSYTERPESKFRFFRPQGVILDVDTKYIHGGGETDAGSGSGKSIDLFKQNYIFGGERERDRLYVSNLIKKATGMNDKEYVQFVEANQNKPLTEIEPPEYREILVKAYASINSNTRTGSRAYNEMYVSNPKDVMAVFAYSMDEPSQVGHPFGFLIRDNDRTNFLQNYAIKHDIPFIVFGD